MDENDNVFKTAGMMGGEKEHLLEDFELPKHSHGIIAFASSGNNYSNVGASLSFTYQSAMTGWWGQTAEGPLNGDQPHNNLQPYVTVYRWRRIK